MSFGNGLGHIAYSIERRADGLRRLVWSMGMPAGGGHQAFEVRAQPRVHSRRAIVACARRGG